MPKALQITEQEYMMFDAMNFGTIAISTGIVKVILIFCVRKQYL